MSTIHPHSSSDDIIDDPFAAVFCLLHELSTFQQARDALAGSLCIKVGNTDTHAIAADLANLVKAIECDCDG